MKLFSILGGFFVAVAVSTVLSVGLVSPAHAADGDSEQKVEKSEEPAKQYVYTAATGDSYTQMVRKAVQTYGINNNVELGNARIVFIETNLAIAAGNPELNEGQSVTINEADVVAWVKKAQQLNDADLAAWQTYVSYIDFNTDAVGVM